MQFQRFQGSDRYIVSPELRDAVNVAVALEKPLLVRGEPGTGKTVLAEAIAESLVMELISWNIKSTSKAQDGLYLYDTVQRLNDARFGDRDITTAGSPEKCDACRRLGADVAVNYKTEDFVASHESRDERQWRRGYNGHGWRGLHRAQLRSGGGGGAYRADCFSGQSEGDGGFPPHYAQAASPHRFDAARTFEFPTKPRLHARSKRTCCR